MPVIDSENAMRNTARVAKRERFEPGVTAGATTLKSTNVQDAIDEVAGAAGGGGGIADAPSDSTLYGRKNAAWTAVPPSGIADAPSDGTLYGRKNAAWVAVPPGGATVTISDTAPVSPSAGNLWWNSALGQMYIYYSDANSSQWVAITNSAGYMASGGGGSGTGSFISTVAGAGTVTVPAGKTTMLGEAWGPGGGASGSAHSSCGGGGGGYSRFTVSVTPGQTIFYTVGTPGVGTTTDALAGSNSWINPSANSQPTSNGCVGACGGLASFSPGGGGSGTVGTVNFSGGSGFGPNGGGGGGAGSAGAGATATSGTGGLGGSPDGGAGATYQGATTGVFGFTPGGGAAGGSGSGGTGGLGQVRLTFS